MNEQQPSQQNIASASDEPQDNGAGTPRRGDIWEDLTPHYHRFVRVIRVLEGKARIERVKLDPRMGWMVTLGSVARDTDLKRFNGKSRGFRLHHRPVYP